MTKKQKNKILTMCKKYRLYFCIWFGSGVEEGRKRYQRDYDLAFYGGKHLKGDLTLKLQKELLSFFDKPIDIILIQPLMDTLLAYEISTKGKLVCELKKDSFLEFQGRTWKDYLDTQRYRDYEKIYIEKKVKHVS